MNTIYYSNTTYWVILVVILTAVATVQLYRLGKASLQAQIMVAATFGIALLAMHWVFGGQNLLPQDLSGGIFYLIILGGAGLGVLLFYLTSQAVFADIPVQPNDDV